MDNRKSFICFIYFMMLMGMVWPLVAVAAPMSQSAGQDYIVQAEDWLSKIADKFYGDPLAYTLIVEGTNLKAAHDDSYGRIDNPNRVDVGQKLFIPTDPAALAQLRQADPAPTDAAPAAQPVSETPAEIAEIITPPAPTEAQSQLLARLNNRGQPPELFNEIWLNSEPLNLADLRGKVVIVEFWTYG